jgi:hypothetical protein
MLHIVTVTLPFQFWCWIALETPDYYILGPWDSVKSDLQRTSWLLHAYACLHCFFLLCCKGIWNKRCTHCSSFLPFVKDGKNSDLIHISSLISWDNMQLASDLSVSILLRPLFFPSFTENCEDEMCVQRLYHMSSHQNSRNRQLQAIIDLTGSHLIFLNLMDLGDDNPVFSERSSTNGSVVERFWKHKNWWEMQKSRQR